MIILNVQKIIIFIDFNLLRNNFIKYDRFRTLVFLQTITLVLLLYIVILRRTFLLLTMNLH